MNCASAEVTQPVWLEAHFQARTDKKIVS